MTKRIQSIKFASLNAALFVVAALALLCTKGQAQTQVRAGEGMGKIHLAETRSSVLKQLGPPTKSLMWETLPLRQDTWVSKKTQSRLTVLYLEPYDRVSQIETTSPSFVTDEGLSVQSTQGDLRRWASDEAQATFLKSNRATNPSYYMMMWDSERGLAFLIKQSSKNPRQWTSEKMMVFGAGNKICFWSRAAYKKVTQEEFFSRITHK